MKERPFTIGRLARTAGVNVETVRYYQRVGLIEEPPKPLAGFRSYARETADRIIFIKRAQRLGFRLREILELLELGDGHCADVRARAEEKRALVDAQLHELEALRGTLDTLIEACLAGDDDAHCPIVETLSGSRRRSS
jgi:MerR family mercuric resistance operon transcriptional regulator